MLYSAARYQIKVQSNLDISKLTIFYKSKLPEVQINLHFG